MGLYSDAPQIRTRYDDKPTLLVCWWCTLFAATIIFFRVSGRYIRTERLFREDWLAAACLIPLFIRMGLVHVVLQYGTNNTLAPVGGWSNEDITRRELGSRMVLASRIFYAATLWMLKLTITEFFKRLTANIWRRSYELMLRTLQAFLLATFIICAVADIAECQSSTDYWQVNRFNPPIRAQCRQGVVSLVSMSVCNIVTDVLLIIFPIPIIIGTSMPLTRKANLVLLFSLSIIPIIITGYRMPAVIGTKGSQQYRSLWASIELLAATAVANAVVLGSFVRDRGVKKLKWKMGSTADSVERTSTRHIRHTTTGLVAQWGSDEDLVRDLGIGLDPKLRDLKRTPRLASTAIGTAHSRSVSADWEFPKSDEPRKGRVRETYRPNSGNTLNSEALLMTGQKEKGEPSTRKLSFFDIGGLLDTDLANSAYQKRKFSNVSNLSVATSYEGSSISPMTTRYSSHAFLKDVGALPPMPPSPSLSTRSHSISRVARSRRMVSASDGFNFELHSIPQKVVIEAQKEAVQDDTNNSASPQNPSQSIVLRDVGGLLG